MAFVEVPRASVNKNANEPCWHRGWRAVAKKNDGGWTYNSNYYAVYKDDEHVTYAVYYKDDGETRLICMLKHAETALRLNDYDELEKKLLDVCRQEALDEGFPETMPRKRFMTWRDIRDMLDAITDDKVLDMNAFVWLYNDVQYPDGDNRITGLRPYDAGCDADEDNELSFTIEEV